MTIQKPMLADNKDWNPSVVAENLPQMAFVKLDGIRMLVHDGVGYSRSLKPLPNKSLQAKVQRCAAELEGFDGEIIIGPLTDERCFKFSHRSCMKEEFTDKVREKDRIKFDLPEDFDMLDLEDHKFYVFDRWDMPDLPKLVRIEMVHEQMEAIMTPELEWVIPLEWEIVETMEELDAFKDECLEHGHEGSIFCSPDGLYKNGRATTKSGLMYKNKSRVDTEVKITAFNELMINNNPKTTNEVGRSQRSSHKAGKAPGGTLGSLTVTGHFEDGRPFTTNVGVFSGFSKAELQHIWDNQDEYADQLVKMKYMGIGSDQSPRTPVVLGFRDRMDT